jgi:hypothetical protein
MDCEDGTVNFKIFHQGKQVAAKEVEVQFN